MERNKRNVAFGAVTGLLIGFVFGSVFGSPDSMNGTSGTGSTKGDVIRVARFSSKAPVAKTSESQTGDTLRLSATDENGEEMQIIIIK